MNRERSFYRAKLLQIEKVLRVSCLLHIPLIYYDGHLVCPNKQICDKMQVCKHVQPFKPKISKLDSILSILSTDADMPFL
jgi:hypothetical protein